MSVMSSWGQSYSSSNLSIVMLELGSSSKSLSPCFALSPTGRPPWEDVRLLGAAGAPPWEDTPVTNSPPSSCKGRSSKRKLRSSQLSPVCSVGVVMIVIPPPPLHGGCGGVFV